MNTDVVCKDCAKLPIPKGWVFSGERVTMRDQYDCAMCGKVSEDGDTFFILVEDK